MPECSRVNPLSWGDCASDSVGAAAASAASSAADSAIDKFADAVAVAVGDGLASLGTLWVSIGTPNLADGAAPGRNAGATPPGAGAIDDVLAYTLYLGLGVCVLSLMVAGARMAMPHRYAQGEGEESARVGTVLLATILISASTALVSGLFRGGRAAQGGETVAFLQNSLWYYTLALAVVSIIVAGIKMAWEQRAQPGRDAVKSLLTLILITGAGLPVLGILVEASDAFSEWIIAGSLDCNPTDGDGSCFRRNITGMIAFGSAGVGAPFMVIILGLIALLTSLFQIMLMVARAGMLVVLAGVLPLAAASTNTEAGSAWFKRALGWLIAWLLYKPAAAIIYATAFHLTGSNVFEDDGTGLVKVLTGLILLIMAVVAIGPLMKFATPAVASLVSSSGSGGMVMAAAAAPAMGAVSAAGRSGSGQSATSSAGQGATVMPAGATSGGRSDGGGEATGSRDGRRGPSGPSTPGSGQSGGQGAGMGVPSGAPVKGGSGAGAAAATGGVAVAVESGAQAAGAAQGAVRQTAEGATGSEGENQ